MITVRHMPDTNAHSDAVQVPIPEMAELRIEGGYFRLEHTRLRPEAPILVPGPEAVNGILRGDHVDIELVIRCAELG